MLTRTEGGMVGVLEKSRPMSLFWGHLFEMTKVHANRVSLIICCVCLSLSL